MSGTTTNQKLLAWVEGQEARLARAVTQGVERRRQRLSDLSRVLPKADALLNDPRQRLDRAEDGLSRGLVRAVERKRGGLEAASARLRPALLRSRFAAQAERLGDRAGRLAPGLLRAVALRKDRLSSVSGRLRSEPMRERVARMTRELGQAEARMMAGYSRTLTRLSDRLVALDRMRVTLGYTETLKRGFAVVRKGDKVITDAADAKGAALEVEFRDGRVEVQAGGRKPAKTGSEKKPDQGSLF